MKNHDYNQKYYKPNPRNKRARGNIISNIIILILLIILISLSIYTIKNRINRSEGKQSEEEIILEKKESRNLEDDISIGNDAQDKLSEKNIIDDNSRKENVSNEEIEEIKKIEDQKPVEKIPVKAKGIYVSAKLANHARMKDLIELVETTEVNAMVIDIKDDEGRITYRMNSPRVKEIGADINYIPDIQNFIQELKDRGVYIIARIVAFKDPYLAEKRKDLSIRNQDGSIYRDNRNEAWVNPYQKEVWEYLIEVASEAAFVGFDEIQFDYIRFSTGKGIANADFGGEAVNKSKEEIILEFTKYAYENLKPLGVFVSADVYGAIINSNVDAALVGQNYVEMSRYLDYICPMIYPSHFGEGNYGIQYPDLEPYNVIRKALLVSKTKIEQLPEDENRAIVRPWLQDFTAKWLKNYQKYGSEQLREQINGVYDAGYEEWILWNASSNYTKGGLLPPE